MREAAPFTGRSRARQIGALAGPITLANLSHTVVSLTDTLMVGRCGDEALAALGAASAIHLALFLVCTSIITGVQVLSARCMGKENPEGAGDVFRSGIWLGLGIALVTSALGLGLSGAICAHFNPSPQVQAMASDYLQFRWGMGLPVVILIFVFKGFFWGVGVTRLDLLTSLLINSLNIILNWVFISGHLGAPALGCAGAGLASALASWVALAICLILVLRGKSWRRFHIRVGRGPRLDVIVPILKLSIPRAIQAAAFGASSLPFFAMVGNLVGSEAQAASAVIWRIFGLNVLISVGIGTATSTLVSRELGRGRPDEAAAFGWTAARLGLGVVGSFSLLVLVAARPVLSAFGLEDGIAAAALPSLRLVLAFQVIDAAGIILSRALIGAGEVIYVMVAEILVAAFVCIPLAWAGIEVLHSYDPLLGAWLGWAGYMSAWMVAMLLRWKSGRWRTRFSGLTPLDPAGE